MQLLRKTEAGRASGYLLPHQRYERALTGGAEFRLRLGPTDARLGRRWKLAESEFFGVTVKASAYRLLERMNRLYGSPTRLH